MRKNLFTICSVLLLAACSSPKYTYYFDHYDYNSGKKKAVELNVTQENDLDESPFATHAETLVASADENMIVLAEEKPVVTEAAPVVDKEAFAKKYNAMTKAEKKEFKKELKSELKAAKKEMKDGKSVEATKRMDKDAKLAIIFGGIGLILILLAGAGDAFLVLGAISLIIGFVFLVQWLSRQ